ncbi:hypothetical protein PVK06_047485 [Gossypium arboreum]|uniref:Uncharacterized protein n=1 Tax=Gossypium arboreum TaxID=29729 RepID=A0ABR0MDF5_GOSAR|nr:hypothetical protein PVK06_047485 [Gossypium arboreum]
MELFITPLYQKRRLQQDHLCPTFLSTKHREIGRGRDGDPWVPTDQAKRTTSIVGAEVYEEWLFGPFRPVVRTSSFHVEDTGSIPVRDRYSFPAAFS